MWLWRGGQENLNLCRSYIQTTSFWLQLEAFQSTDCCICKLLLCHVTPIWVRNLFPSTSPPSFIPLLSPFLLRPPLSAEVRSSETVGISPTETYPELPDRCLCGSLRPRWTLAACRTPVGSTNTNRQMKCSALPLETEVQPAGFCFLYFNS